MNKIICFFSCIVVTTNAAVPFWKSLYSVESPTYLSTTQESELKHYIIDRNPTVKNKIKPLVYRYQSKTDYSDNYKEDDDSRVWPHDFAANYDQTADIADVDKPKEEIIEQKTAPKVSEGINNEKTDDNIYLNDFATNYKPNDVLRPTATSDEDNSKVVYYYPSHYASFQTLLNNYEAENKSVDENEASVAKNEVETRISKSLTSSNPILIDDFSEDTQNENGVYYMPNWSSAANGQIRSTDIPSERDAIATSTEESLASISTGSHNTRVWPQDFLTNNTSKTAKTNSAPVWSQAAFDNEASISTSAPSSSGPLQQDSSAAEINPNYSVEKNRTLNGFSKESQTEEGIYYISMWKSTVKADSHKLASKKYNVPEETNVPARSEFMPASTERSHNLNRVWPNDFTSNYKPSGYLSYDIDKENKNVIEESSSSTSVPTSTAINTISSDIEKTTLKKDEYYTPIWTSIPKEESHRESALRENNVPTGTSKNLYYVPVWSTNVPSESDVMPTSTKNGISSVSANAGVPFWKSLYSTESPTYLSTTQESELKHYIIDRNPTVNNKIKPLVYRDQSKMDYSGDDKVDDDNRVWPHDIAENYQTADLADVDKPKVEIIEKKTAPKVSEGINNEKTDDNIYFIDFATNYKPNDVLRPTASSDEDNSKVVYYYPSHYASFQTLLNNYEAENKSVDENETSVAKNKSTNPTLINDFSEENQNENGVYYVPNWSSATNGPIQSTDIPSESDAIASSTEDSFASISTGSHDIRVWPQDFLKNQQSSQTTETSGARIWSQAALDNEASISTSVSSSSGSLQQDSATAEMNPNDSDEENTTLEGFSEESQAEEGIYYMPIWTSTVKADSHKLISKKYNGPEETNENVPVRLTNVPAKSEFKSASTERSHTLDSTKNRVWPNDFASIYKPSGFQSYVIDKENKNVIEESSSSTSAPTSTEINTISPDIQRTTIIKGYSGEHHKDEYYTPIWTSIPKEESQRESDLKKNNVPTGTSENLYYVPVWSTNVLSESDVMPSSTKNSISSVSTHNNDVRVWPQDFLADQQKTDKNVAESPTIPWLINNEETNKKSNAPVWIQDDHSDDTDSEKHVREEIIVEKVKTNKDYDTFPTIPWYTSEPKQGSTAPVWLGDSSIDSNDVREPLQDNPTILESKQPEKKEEFPHEIAHDDEQLSMTDNRVSPDDLKSTESDTHTTVSSLKISNLEENLRVLDLWMPGQSFTPSTATQTTKNGVESSTTLSTEKPAITNAMPATSSTNSPINMSDKDGNPPVVWRGDGIYFPTTSSKSPTIIASPRSEYKNIISSNPDRIWDLESSNRNHQKTDKIEAEFKIPPERQTDRKQEANAGVPFWKSLYSTESPTYLSTTQESELKHYIIDRNPTVNNKIKPLVYRDQSKTNYSDNYKEDDDKRVWPHDFAANYQTADIAEVDKPKEDIIEQKTAPKDSEGINNVTDDNIYLNDFATNYKPNDVLHTTESTDEDNSKAVYYYPSRYASFQHLLNNYEVENKSVAENEGSVAKNEVDTSISTSLPSSNPTLTDDVSEETQNDNGVYYMPNWSSAANEPIRSNDIPSESDAIATSTEGSLASISTGSHDTRVWPQDFLKNQQTSPTTETYGSISTSVSSSSEPLQQDSATAKINPNDSDEEITTLEGLSEESQKEGGIYYVPIWSSTPKADSHELVSKEYNVPEETNENVPVWTTNVPAKSEFMPASTGSSYTLASTKNRVWPNNFASNYKPSGYPSYDFNKENKNVIEESLLSTSIPTSNEINTISSDKEKATLIKGFSGEHHKDEYYTPIWTSIPKEESHRESDLKENNVPTGTSENLYYVPVWSTIAPSESDVMPTSTKKSISSVSLDNNDVRIWPHDFLAGQQKTDKIEAKSPTIPWLINNEETNKKSNAPVWIQDDHSDDTDSEKHVREEIIVEKVKTNKDYDTIPTIPWYTSEPKQGSTAPVWLGDSSIDSNDIREPLQDNPTILESKQPEKKEEFPHEIAHDDEQLSTTLAYERYPNPSITDNRVSPDDMKSTESDTHTSVSNPKTSNLEENLRVIDLDRTATQTTKNDDLESSSTLSTEKPAITNAIPATSSTNSPVVWRGDGIYYPTTSTKSPTKTSRTDTKSPRYEYKNIKSSSPETIWGLESSDRNPIPIKEVKKTTTKPISSSTAANSSSLPIMNLMKTTRRPSGRTSKPVETVVISSKHSHSTSRPNTAQTEISNKHSPAITELPRPTSSVSNKAWSTTLKPDVAPVPSSAVSVLLKNVTVNDALCKEANGRYIAGNQCDAYIECKDFKARLYLCPDGLRFNPDAPPEDYPCFYPKDVSCEGRPALQKARVTKGCPHSFGYFRIGEASECGRFRVCTAGYAYDFSCPEGLAYNEITYRCEWADTLSSCNAPKFIGFQCPTVITDDASLEAPKNYYFSYPSDCTKYYACVEGQPRVLRCDKGFAFNKELALCSPKELVPNCIDGRKHHH